MTSARSAGSVMGTRSERRRGVERAQIAHSAENSKKDLKAKRQIQRCSGKKKGEKRNAKGNALTAFAADFAFLDIPKALGLDDFGLLFGIVTGTVFVNLLFLLFQVWIRHKIDLLCGQYSTAAGREQEERRNTMPRRVTADVPTEEAILAYNNVPIELAAKFIGWSDITIRYALQEERAPFGMAAQNPKTGTWSYNISPGLLLKYKSGELPAWKLKELSAMLADHAERIIDERVGSVGKLIDKLLGGKSA